MKHVQVTNIDHATVTIAGATTKRWRELSDEAHRLATPVFGADKNRALAIIDNLRELASEVERDAQVLCAQLKRSSDTANLASADFADGLRREADKLARSMEGEKPKRYPNLKNQNA